MKKGLAVLVSMAAFGAAHAVFLIDDFTTGAYGTAIQSGDDLNFEAASVPGGDRATLLIVEANPLNMFADLAVGGGAAVVSSGTLTDVFFALGYGFDPDGSGGTTFDDMNLDLSAETAFRVTFLANDLPQTMTVHVVSGGTIFSHSLAVPGGIVSSTTFDVAFSNFAGADFSDIDQIEFDFDSGPSGDFALGRLEAVPEPATIAGLGLAALALIRRKRSA